MERVEAALARRDGIALQDCGRAARAAPQPNRRAAFLRRQSVGTIDAVAGQEAEHQYSTICAGAAARRRARRRSRGLGGRGPIVRAAPAAAAGIGAIIVILVVSYFLGINPLELLNGGTSAPTPTQTSTVRPARRRRDARVRGDRARRHGGHLDGRSSRSGEEISAADADALLRQRQLGLRLASAATGPFYCPGDQNVYIDLDFYNELRSRFGAPGDFAQAYVLAHEVGHHVQNVLGILPKVHAQRGASSARPRRTRFPSAPSCRPTASPASGRTTREQEGILDPGDIDEALTAAAAVGDDALQKQAQGYVVPDSFTHGTSEQRGELVQARL